ncbi:MAG: FxsA family protein, partial [Proteobacteria bacterium]|nr:FxsA family protein [Pseudomonadota bacterium]
MWLLVRLLLLFTLVPAIELFILLQIGSLLGPNLAFVIILVTGLAGAWLAKREGWMVLQHLRQELQRGIPPANRLMEGVLVLAGGLLLITPGVLTDITG